MKIKTLLTFTVAISVAAISFAQTTVFKVQGHERKDIELQSRNSTSALSDNDTGFSFDNIIYWIGEGSNKAALVIDWHDHENKSDHAMVWGYRWNGEATGYDMVAAIANADPRLTFLTHLTDLGNTVAGLGYDLNESMDTKIIYTDPETFDETVYTPINGMVTTQAYNYDDWTCSDPADLWQSGWYTNGYWSYQVKDATENEWNYSGLGASSRILTDGCWDGWSFADFSGISGTIPRTPYQAVTRPEKEPTDENTYWGQTFKNPHHQSIVEVPLAINKENISEKWSATLYSGFGSSGSPVVAGDYIFIAAGGNLKKYSILTGELIAESPLEGRTGFFSFIAYGDGKIFVPQNNGLLQAFDAVTLKSLWTAQTEDKGQQLCPVVYHDGYIYTGTWKSKGTGVYYCISTEDKENENSAETKDFVWQTENAGYYWSGGTIVGDHIFVGNDLGQMLSLNRLSGEVKDSWIIDAELSTSTIRCGTSYDEKTGRLFFTGKETKKIYSVIINEDGTFNAESKMSADVAGQPTTAPTVHNGRVYACSGTMTSGGGFDVFDAETLEKIYTVDMGGISQSTPVISTAFANESNNNTVYIYVCLNNSTGDIVCIKDFEGNTEPIIQYKWTAPTTQYCTWSMVVDQYGTMYYKNDSGNLWALGSTFNVEGITLDQTEMKIPLDGAFHPITAIVTPLFANNRQVIWKSSDPKVATVDVNSRIMPLSVGTTVITATTEDGGFSAECTVTVQSKTSTDTDNPAIIQSVYPNPVSNMLYIESNANRTMYMFSDNGIFILSAQLSAGQNAIDVADMPTGSYIIRCDNETYKIIKR